MELKNLIARPIGGAAQIWWDDNDGNRYRLDLARDLERGALASPLALASTAKGRYSDGPRGQWVVKLCPPPDPRSLSRHIYMDATGKKWAPVVAEALRRVEDGDMIAKAREADRAAEELREETQKAERAEKIKDGIDRLAEETEEGWFRKALIDLSLHATRDDLIRLQRATQP